MDIFEIKDHNSLFDFYEANNLEVSADISKDDNAIFSIAVFDNSRLIAAATSSLRKNYFILDYIAVLPEFRKKGLGGELLEKTIEKAKHLGAKNIYITAREPAFFKKYGFIKGSPNGMDMNAGCIGCPQYNTTCVSTPMVLKLGE